ncbi:serpin-2 precursor [Leptotrombidium deliense]|uniref:Serpin-2 n=1 Tax=Leptotrombidium deliense TaxID=299467 RepID=A0A443SR46_9ACAR|nr:serpin-2 precursor [Leptotrombidium deliense]
MKNEYFAAVGSEDFEKNGQQIMQRVNKFVKERTHDLIESVLNEPLKADTVMFLLNSIYFKAYWTNMFHRHWTHKSSFHNSDQTESTVDFLSEDQLGYRHKIDTENNVTLLEMDYLGNASMIFVLPHERYGLQRVMDTITYEQIENIFASSKTSKIPVKLPKFKFEFEADLKSILPKMGLSSIFEKPDLSGIAPNIKVSDAKHKALISVDEGGTEAAAITTLRIIPTSLFTGPEFTADHPFLFFIRDKKSGLNLFDGCVNKV